MAFGRVLIQAEAMPLWEALIPAMALRVAGIVENVAGAGTVLSTWNEGMAIGNFYSGRACQVDAKDKHRAREYASGGRGMGLALLGEGEMAPPRKRMCLR